jgi:muramoyltetrapeptide carboxypeptidase LdcA involved in peptidoglycan recycling
VNFCALWSLRLHGWFEGLHGILIGRNAAPDAKQAADLNYLDALHSAFADTSCPVLYDLDIGHLPPQLSLVNGAMAHVSFQGDSGNVRQSLA